jgi:serine protease Do
VLSVPRDDLAVLKVDGAAPFPAAVLADSSQVEVGDWVLAVGNPFGLSHTVTAGIISARRSSLMISGVQYSGLLQTDAPINKGSSGGPLVNLAGEVVGINTAIYAPTGVFNGTGFAIPSNRVARIVARVLEGQPGAVAQAALPVSPEAAPAPAVWLGLGVVDVSAALAAKLALVQPTGVFVNTVAQGSPAEEAEVVRGDVITELGGRPIASTAGLLATLPALPVGQVVRLTVWRSGASKTLKLKIVARQMARR